MTNSMEKNHPIRQVCTEYVLVARPGDAIETLVQQEKDEFSRSYGHGSTERSRPHIVVGKFLATEPMEQTVIAWLQRICSVQQSFTVMLNNYSGFPAHTIYMRVQNQQPFSALARQLKQIDSYVLGSAGYPVQWATQPHLAIANHLPEDVYAAALKDYAHKEFTGSFVVHELLLKRRASGYAPAKTIAVFGLRPEVAPLFFHPQLQLF